MTVPSPTVRSFRLRHLTTLALIASSIAAASGAVLYWDPNGATAGTGGSGTWDTSGLYFRNGSTSGALEDWANDNPSSDEAVFGGASGGSVTIANSYIVDVNRLTFTTNGYSLLRGNSNSAISFSGVAPTISISSGVTVTSSVKLTGSPITITGGGTFQLGASNRIANPLDLTIAGGSTLAMAMFSDTVGDVTLANGTISGSGTLSTTGAFDLQSGTVSAALGGSNITVNKTTAGTVTLNGNNSYTGTTTVSAGTLALGGSERLANGSSLAVSGGTFSMSGFAETVSGFTLNSGSVTGSGTLTATSGFTVNSGSIGATLGGSAGLTKLSSGTVSLSGTTSYSGATAVNAGTLLFSGTMNNTAVSIANGATFGGSGTLNGTVVVNGTISPTGVLGSIGTLSTGAETWNGGGSLLLQINNATGIAGTNWDRLNLSAGLTINATNANRFIINLDGLNGSGALGLVTNFNQASSYSWTIANAASIAGFAPDKFTVDASDFALNNPYTGVFSLTATTNTLNLVYTPIPEPHVYALLLGLGTLGFVVVRRVLQRKPATSAK